MPPTAAPAAPGTLFELQLPLPDARLGALGARLIGFEQRYARIKADLRLIADPDGVAAWARKYHGDELPILDALNDRYPLVVLHGDVGTGKTATAQAAAARLAQATGKEGMLFTLSTRVRGSGMVGEMSTLINDAFQAITTAAGKSRTAYLIIDEADSLAGSRRTVQSHHEDKAGVNTLIQKIDEMRAHGGRVVVFLCTNRFEALDPAILRRAMLVEQFDRPDAGERRLLLEHDLRGVKLAPGILDELVQLTGAKGAGPGFTFSDIRTRLLPRAVAAAYPARGLTADDLLEAAGALEATPQFAETPATGRP